MTITQEGMDDFLANPHQYEKTFCENSLLDFVGFAWPSLEPEVTFIKGWVVETMARHLEAVSNGTIKRLLINVPPGFCKSLLVNVFWPAWEWGPKNQAHHRFISASYEKTLATRDLVRCRDLLQDEWYSSHWPITFKGDENQKTRYENSKTGWRQSASVGSALTGHRGDRIIIDDPHSVKTAESELEREKSLRWMSETIPTRLNKQGESAIVVIMQRLHARDVSGLIIDELGEDYVHLCLPMEFETTNRCWTKIPSPFGPPEIRRRVKDEADPIPTYQPCDKDHPDAELLYPQDPRQIDGELAWPERFPHHSVEALKRAFRAVGGSYAEACNPGEAPILMSDLSLRRIDEVREGDEVVGFDRPVAKDGTEYARNHLERTTVVGVTSMVRPVVKMTFESGEVIRCTPEHRWFKRSGRDYSPATVGSRLRRVCPASLPTLSREDERVAGWLSGMFDGDGTATNCEKRGQPGYRPSVSLTFTQGDGRNAPICDKIERSLERLGFRWAVSLRDRGTHNVRNYRVLNDGLSTLQRFLHLVQPTKWRDRIIQGAYGAKFARAGKERVVKIEPDGEDTVYALQTTTGNYVVWGLASANSQLQQRPVPRGGGMFSRDSWVIVPERPHIPGHSVRGWDLAASTGKSAAFTVGLLLTILDDGRLVVEDVRRLRGSGLAVEEAILQCAEIDGFSTQISIPQDPGQAGKAQVAGFARMLHGYDTSFTPESGDKETRAIPIAAQVEAGNVLVVKAPWNDTLFAEAGLFPNSQWKDQVDALSRAYHQILKGHNEISLFGPKLILPNDHDDVLGY